MPKAALVILCDKPLNNLINAIPNFQITRLKIRIFSTVISVKILTQFQLPSYSVGKSVVHLNENHSGHLYLNSASPCRQQVFIGHKNRQTQRDIVRYSA